MSTDEAGSGGGTRGARQKACSRCGTTFACGAEQGPCWCDDVKLSAAELAELRVQFADCLCAGCLAAVAKAKRDS